MPLYNPMPADWLLTKPMQIALLDRAGMPVPETIWTNDPDAVRRFAEGRRVAYKPVAGGAATKELGPEDLTEERLARSAGRPVTFQELLPGDNYRVYVRRRRSGCGDQGRVGVARLSATGRDDRADDAARTRP